MTEKQWYAVHTYSGHENKVKTNIERRAESMNLKDRIFRILVPTEAELRTRGGKKQEVQRKVFPGYVLIEMVLDDQTWYLVKSTTGVTGFVSSGNKPVPFRIERFRESLMQSRLLTADPRSNGRKTRSSVSTPVRLRTSRAR